MAKAKNETFQDEMPGRPIASQNEAPTQKERAVTPSSELQLDPGPRKGERGEYLPAVYRLSSGTIRQDR